jgi:hypothetical protein
MSQKPRQIRTTLQGNHLIEFETLTETLGLSPSATLKLAIRRLAALELNQAAFSVDSEKAA